MDKNSLGINHYIVPTKVIELAEENTPENLPKHKRIVLEHCALKGLQYGAAASLVLLPPYYYFVRRFHTFQLFSRLHTVSALTAAGGCAVSTGAGAVRLRNLSQDGVYDWAHRLSHDHKHHFIDAISLMASGCSGIMAVLTGWPFVFRPHYGHTVPPEKLKMKLLRGGCATLNGFGIGLLTALMVSVYVPETVGHKQIDVGRQMAESRGLEFVRGLATDEDDEEEAEYTPSVPEEDVRG